MANVKYFKAIEAAQKKDPLASAGALPPFDFTALAPSGFKAKIANALFPKILSIAYTVSRAFFPVVKFAGFYHVTRDAQVRDVLLRPEDFRVPFGPEMNELAGGVTFALGLDGVPQARQNALVRKLIQPGEDIARINALTADFAEALLENSSGKIDAIGDFFKRITTEVCARYFGLTIDDTDGFADWMMACSSLLFGDPYGDENIRKIALSGAARLRMTFDDSIQRTRVRLKRQDALHCANATILERLLALQVAQAASDPISDAEIRAILFGMLTGFVPTNTLAAGKMLDELNKHKAGFEDAVVAANAGAEGRDRLTQIVLEAGRLNPAISPGVWRYCPEAAEIRIGSKVKKIPAGSVLLVSTMSAMRDKRALSKPGKFWPERTNEKGEPFEPDLMFGDGTHWCVGKYLAIEQITEMVAALLRQKNIRASKGKEGKLRSVGAFPRHLSMTYDSPASQQSMFLVIAPVTSGASKYAVDKEIAKLGHPAETAIREALDKTGLVHFASLATILTDHDGLFISFELSADGSIPEAIGAIAANAEHLLRPIFAHAGLRESNNLESFLNTHVVKLQGKPWGANGLNYNGLPEFSVNMVDKQARFADFSGRVLRDYVATETARGSHPMLAMGHLRRILRGDPELKADATPAQIALMDEAAEHKFDAYCMMTDAARLKLTRYRPVPYITAFFNFLKSRDGLIITLPLIALFAVFNWAFWYKAAGPIGWQILITATKALLATILVASAIVGLFLIKLRRAETSDEPSTIQAPIDKMHAVMNQENPPGFAHNHILAAANMKPGWFRAFTHALALWGIKMTIVHSYRPGLVINMGSIHYARWFRIPGTNKAAFYSNFDGSWESYLEDFITRAAPGQSAAWSNWEGYPKTRFLIGQGAADGDAFKRFTRNVQQIVPFWYSRFPAMTTEQIRTNAIIHSGACLARTTSESEEWLRCFGSMPRVDNRIESDEVQALMFRGMKRLSYSSALAVRLPEAGGALGEWLCWVRGRPMQAANTGGAAEIARLVDEGVLIPVPRPDGRPPEHALAHALTIAFGDRPLTGDDEATLSNAAKIGTAATRDAIAATSRAVFLALSAAGMFKFTAPNVADEVLLEGFPFAFRMGMAARDRINGDRGRDAPSGWRWQDDARSSGATEAMLMLYAATPEQRDQMVQIHTALIENHGGAVLNQTDCAPAWTDPEKADFEHFGYRDGISQPVIRGTLRALRGVPARDIVEPGEFILGYKSGQGYYPPSPQLPPVADMRGALPVVADGVTSRFPDFGDKSITEGLRDLGRNGSYMVVRELRQDVDEFNRSIETATAQLNQGGLTDLYRLTGQAPDAEWVKAKLMGRWPNGRPLVGCPVNKPSRPGTLPAELENDFSYGEDDPQGLACPFGSHIRRTNPRDSKEPGDEWEQVISNRHRLLRRGRSYVRPDGEKGLLFVSLCTDIERQFEFVQQFWSNAPAFHGLDNEPDPFVGADPLCPITGEPKKRVFTIPTPAGPLQLTGLKSFVQTMAGGYFFLPSRSALGWLSDISLHALPKNTDTDNKDAPS